MKTVFTFNTATNAWVDASGNVSLETASGSTMPLIESTDDHDQHTIGTLLVHVMVNNAPVALTIDVCHNVLCGGCGDSVGAMASEKNAADFAAASGLPASYVEDITEQVAYGINEGWQSIKEEACAYDRNTDEEVAFPWTLENMTLNSAV